MRINPESLARASSRHPWRVIGVWGVLFLAMVGVSSSLLGGVLTNDISFTNKPESIKAQDVIDAQFATAESGASTEYVIVHSDSLTVDDPAYQAFVKQLQSDAGARRRTWSPRRRPRYYDVARAVARRGGRTRLARTSTTR